MNITDVDSKILAASRRTRRPPEDVAEQYEEEFWEEMRELRCVRPDYVRRVTEEMQDIVKYVERIVENGYGYVVPRIRDAGPHNVERGVGPGVEPGVYFDVRAFEGRDEDREGGGGSGYNKNYRRNRYGKLGPPEAGVPVDVTGGRGVVVRGEAVRGEVVRGEAVRDGVETKTKRKIREAKKDGRDFVLWRLTNTDHVADDFSLEFDSPWGKGLPGWHVECSAIVEGMRRDVEEEVREGIGENDGVDGVNKVNKVEVKKWVHSGGRDLMFPHHCNEIAQGEAWEDTGRDTDRDGDIDRGGDGHVSQEWIPHFLHPPPLLIKGLKMSKSLKNFITLRSLRESYHGSEVEGGGVVGGGRWRHGDVFRLWCLTGSGRSRRMGKVYTEEGLRDAGKRLDVIRVRLVQLWGGGVRGGKERERERAKEKEKEKEKESRGKVELREDRDKTIQVNRRVNKFRIECHNYLNPTHPNVPPNVPTNPALLHPSYLIHAVTRLLDDLVESGGSQGGEGNKKDHDSTDLLHGASHESLVNAALEVGEVLSWIGFSEETTRPWDTGHHHHAPHPPHNGKNNHHPNDERILSALRDFRDNVRKIARKNVQKTGKNNKKKGQNTPGEDCSKSEKAAEIACELLEACDGIRDRFPEVFSEGDGRA